MKQIEYDVPMVDAITDKDESVQVEIQDRREKGMGYQVIYIHVNGITKVRLAIRGELEVINESA